MTHDRLGVDDQSWAGRLVRKARKRAALRDCGPSTYLKFVTASLDDIERNGNLTRIGRYLYGQNVVRCTVTRLELVALLKRHPEIGEIPVESPIIVTGLYRSGTTLLHRLLAASRDVDAPLFWQLVGVGSNATDQEKHRAGRWSRRIHRFLSPGFEDAHEILVDDVEECFHLFEHCAPTSPYWMTAAQDHAWWMLAPEQAADLVAAYEFYKLQLQVLAWRHGERDAGGDLKPIRWLLKWPYHLWHLEALQTVFSDLRVVVCRRDTTPAGFESTVASICSLASHGLKPFTGRLDRHRHGSFWWEHCKRGVERFEAARPLFGDNLQEVDFQDLCADPTAVAASLATWLGIDRPAAGAAAQLERRRRTHRYSAADYGLPPVSHS